MSSHAIVALLAVALPSSAPANHWTRSYPVTAPVALRVASDEGSVVVRGGNAATVEVHVTTDGWSISGGDVKVIDHHAGHRVDIEVRAPNGLWSIGRKSIRVEIGAPRETSVEIRTAGGSVTIENLAGDARLRAASGGIRVDAFDGSLRARTGDGRIAFRGRFDNLGLETADGGIEGDILEGSRLASSWRVKTGDGSVHLRLPPGLAANLDARTGDGSIRSEWVLDGPGTRSGPALRGKLNGGGPTFSIRTRDGSVHLERL